ncbi:uncharacterized protein LOC115672085 [Syzygium oleosum]|uniref:uncharacterized protein LOC115672085 n=1 Tax=Syzygium oleosum TaxID=219896 RepID=UPI0011D1841D|nr:uncharacterized protein LOC115672085 [Syzygium oleosum]
MDFFTKTAAVKLRSHLDKYLVPGAGEGEPVRQSRSGGRSRASTWAVERVEGKSHVIRLRSCQGGYLAATEDAFLLGMTGNKVAVASPTGGEELDQWNTEWEPIRDGFQVRLKSWCGKFLRANGGTPPWRNSVTHDEPYTGGTRKWILWDVEAVEAEAAAEGGALEKYLASMSSMSSVAEDALSVLGSESGGSPRKSDVSNLSSHHDQFSYHSSNKHRSGMDFFHRAKAVRLRSHHHKYLLANEDEESVSQDRKGSSKNAKWTVERVNSNDDENGCIFIRLKGCYGRYLTASNKPFLLGISGCKVLQTLPRRLDSSVEWEPIQEGNRIKLRTRYGNFLRANKGLPPLRDSVTHDIPQRTTTQDWILWEVDIMEIEVDSPSASDQLGQAPPIDRDADLSMVSENSFSSSVSEISGNLSRQESSESLVASLPPPPASPPPTRVTEGRIIYYHIADENGEVVGEDMEGYCLNNFKGNSVEELSRKLSEETGIDSLVVCSHNPLNGRLFPLRLRLPPNIIMRVVVVPSFSSAASDLANQGIL